jgi:diaminohydroxyphosphoribosylaminopyrimidine deaminase/5-amino-6-(5-phosphoribosylamino)uracil reductase
MATRGPDAVHTAQQRKFMRRALALAARGWGQTAPNPMVGAVVVRDDVVVGVGFHARYGEAHAEVAALTSAGVSARGATIYVTLEPCNHHGKQPPCVDAIIAAGIAHVVAATPDPNPVAADGAARLRAAGITVEFGLEADAAHELNAPFFFAASASASVAPRPWITLKLAVSLDGAIAGPPGEPRWLTGGKARKYVHRLRANHDAIAVGIGTALADDPALTVRYGKRPRVAPTRVIFDRSARLPLKSALVKSARRTPVLVVAADSSTPAARALEAKGAGLVDAATLESAMTQLRARGLRSLFVEGGATLAGALLNAGLVDRLIIFQAPVLLGPGSLPAFTGASPIERLRIVERQSFDDDLMTVYALPQPAV